MTSTIQIKRVGVSILLSAIQLYWWKDLHSPIWVLTFSSIANFLILVVFAHFITTRPSWALILRGLRETLLVTLLVDGVLVALLGFSLWGNDGYEGYKSFAGTSAVFLLFLFLAMLIFHTLDYRIRTGQPKLVYTLRQLIVATAALALFVSFNSSPRSYYYSGDSSVMTYGWPARILQTGVTDPSVDWISVALNLFAIDSRRFLSFIPWWNACATNPDRICCTGNDCDCVYVDRSHAEFSAEQKRN